MRPPRKPINSPICPMQILRSPILMNANPPQAIIARPSDAKAKPTDLVRPHASPNFRSRPSVEICRSNMDCLPILNINILICV